MASISTWSTTAANNNGTPPNGAPEGMNPSAVNDVIRENMAQVRTQMEGAEWFNWGDTVTYVSATSFTISGDVTSRYHTGRRIKATDSSTLYGVISSSSYGAPNTTVNVTLDSGALSGSLTSVALGILSSSNDAIPSGLNAAKIADGSVSNAEYQRLNGVTGAIQTQLDAKQASVDTGTNNVKAGTSALSSLTSGTHNTAVGAFAFGSVASGSENTGVGNVAGVYATGNSNTVLGHSALSGTSNTASFTVAVGSYTADAASMSGGYNTIVGYSAGSGVTTGSYNTFMGNDAGTAVTTGDYNVALGFSAMLTATTAYDCVAVGTRALDAIVSSTGCVAVGYHAGSACTNSNNTYIGYQAGAAHATGANCSVIGYNAEASSTSVNNEITLGNSSIATIRAQVTSITSLSDKRDKTNIQDLNAGLGFINRLRPVRFDWDMRDGGKVGVEDTGFIAQELQSAQVNDERIPGLVYDVNPEKLEAAYGKLIPVLVKAIQELSAEVEALKNGQATTP